MKTPLKFFALVICSVFATLAYTSCNRDQCKTIVCANGGVCNGGVCTCPLGYDGTNCEDTMRNKFLGNWQVLEKGSNSVANQYPVTILPGTANLTDVIILNFYDFFTVPILASVVNDSIIIPNQTYQGKTVFGVGYISTSTTYDQFASITMRYEVIDTTVNPATVNDFGYNPNVDHSSPSQWNK